MPIDIGQPTDPDTIWEISAADLRAHLQAAANRNPVLNEMMQRGMRDEVPFDQCLIRSVIVLADCMNIMAIEMADMETGLGNAKIATEANLREIFKGNDDGRP